MNWTAVAIGLIGAVIGAGASSFTALRVLRHQLKDAAAARSNAERAAVLGALGPAFAALHAHARALPRDVLDGTEQDWSAAWSEKLRSARMTALEIEHRETRERLINGMKYISSLGMLKYAVEHEAARSWLLCRVIDDMQECVYAWRRGDALPEPSQAYQEAYHSWGMVTDEYERDIEHEAEERQRKAEERRRAREE